MLLTQEREQVQTAGLGEGNAFTIKASSKAFEILSSNLYQNKILAVIREISCNAADAHTVVGKPLSEIEVHLPTWADPTFRVRDYGTGLSHEQMLHLYTTYFESTKDYRPAPSPDSSLQEVKEYALFKKQIGGFGLGTKAPFAVADQFTVTSYYGGHKRTYICYKQDGLPAINLVSDQLSSEPSGLEVSVVVPGGDRNKWAAEASTYFQWWSQAPKGIEVDSLWDSPAFADKDANWFVRGGNYVTPVVFMGLVPYTLNFEALHGVPQFIKESFEQLGLVLQFEVGDLSINPNRETLSYDPKTCAALIARLKEVHKNLAARFQVTIDALPTLYEARKFVYLEQPDCGLPEILRRRMKFQWRGQPINETVTVDIAQQLAPDPTAQSGITLRHYYPQNSYSFNPRWNVGGSEYYSFQHMVRKESRKFIYTDAVTAKTYRTLKYNSYKYGYRIITGLTYAEMARKFDELGLPPLEHINTLVEPPKIVRSSSSAPTTKAYVWDGKEFKRTEQAVDLKGGGYYIEFFNGYPQSMSHVCLSSSITAKFIDSSKPIIGLTTARLGSRNVANLTKHGWQKLSPDWLTSNVTPEQIRAVRLPMYLDSLMPRQYLWSAHIRSMFVCLRNLSTNQTFNDLADWYKAAGGADMTYSQHFYFPAFDLTTAQAAAKNTAEADAKKFWQDVQTFLATKPLLLYIGVHNTQDFQQHVASYINS